MLPKVKSLYSTLEHLEDFLEIHLLFFFKCKGNFDLPVRNELDVSH